VIEVPRRLHARRTLKDSFVISTRHRTPAGADEDFLTRLGFNSKMVVTGDITQIDLRRTSGRARRRRRDPRVDRGHRVRCASAAKTSFAQLVQRIVEAYGEHAERLAPELRRPTVGGLSRWTTSPARGRGHRSELAPDGLQVGDVQQLCGLALRCALADD